jgi:DNA-binding transcriptional regulator YhcF (GntR family)
MSWNFQNDRPIYIQLKEQIKRLIVSGVYPPGSKLPSVRDMAFEAAVNPNTLQKALSELERDQLVYSQRTSGRYVTEDENMILQAKNQLAVEQIQQFFEKMKDMGYDKETTLSLIQSAIKEME